MLLNVCRFANMRVTAKLTHSSSLMDVLYFQDSRNDFNWCRCDFGFERDFKIRTVSWYICGDVCILWWNYCRLGWSPEAWLLNPSLTFQLSVIFTTYWCLRSLFWSWFYNFSLTSFMLVLIFYVDANIQLLIVWNSKLYRTAKWRALLAGAIAGPSMLLTGLNTEHTSLAIYILMRATVLASRCGIKSKRYGHLCKPLTWAHGDIFLMCLSSSQIL